MKTRIRSSLVLAALLLTAVGAEAATIIVDQSGAEDATTIKDGVALASNGDTILVRSGTSA